MLICCVTVLDQSLRGYPNRIVLDCSEQKYIHLWRLSITGTAYQVGSIVVGDPYGSMTLFGFRKKSLPKSAQ